MQQERPTLLVLKPSVFSVTVSLVLGTIMLGVSNWSYIIDSLPFYDYFFGPEGLVTNLQNSEEGTQAVADTLFSQSLVNNILTLLAALGVGVVVFVILEAVRRLRTPNVPIPPREAHRKAAIRITVGILWLPKGFLYIAFGLALFCLCLHVHVICARLMMLRLRVFGGTATLLDAERHY